MCKQCLRQRPHWWLFPLYSTRYAGLASQYGAREAPMRKATTTASIENNSSSSMQDVFKQAQSQSQSNIQSDISRTAKESERGSLQNKGSLNSSHRAKASVPLRKFSARSRIAACCQSFCPCLVGWGVPTCYLCKGGNRNGRSHWSTPHLWLLVCRGMPRCSLSEAPALRATKGTKRPKGVLWVWWVSWAEIAPYDPYGGILRLNGLASYGKFGSSASSMAFVHDINMLFLESCEIPSSSLGTRFKRWSNKPTFPGKKNFAWLQDRDKLWADGISIILVSNYIYIICIYM